MATYILEPTIEYLHGHYSNELPPVLTIESGDVIRYRTLEAGWHTLDNPDPFELLSARCNQIASRVI